MRRIECLDKQGNLVGEIEDEPDGPAPEMPDDERSEGERRDARRDERLLGLLLKAQDVALNRRESEIRTIVSTATAMLTAQTGAMATLVDTFNRQREAAEAARDALVAEGGGFEKLIEHLPALMPMLMPIAQRMGFITAPPRVLAAPAKPAAATNGVTSS